MTYQCQTCKYESQEEGDCCGKTMEKMCQDCNHPENQCTCN